MLNPVKLSIVPKVFVVRSYPERVKTYQKVLNANGEVVEYREIECYRVVVKDDKRLYYLYFENNGINLEIGTKIKVRKLLDKTIIEVIEDVKCSGLRENQTSKTSKCIYDISSWSKI